MKGFVRAAAWAALAWACAAQAETRYRVLELEQGPGSYPQAISEGGLVAANSVSKRARAFTCHWDNRCQRMAPLVDERPHSEHIRGLNDQGMAVGESVHHRFTQAVVWVDGAPIDIGNADHKASSAATGVNNSGVVVGTEQLARKGGRGQGFVWRAGVKTDIGTLPGASYSSLYRINDAGLAVGNGDLWYGSYRAITYDTSTGVMTDMGTSPGANDSVGYAINASGDIAGTSGPTAMRTVGGVMQDLGVLPGYPSGSIATGINDQGETVGRSYWGYIFDSHGFIYDDEGMHDLNDLLVDVDRGKYVIYDALDINNHGDIAAWALHHGGYMAVILKRVSR